MAMLYLIFLGLTVRCSTQEISGPSTCGREAVTCKDYDVLRMRLADMENAVSQLYRQSGHTGKCEYTDRGTHDIQGDTQTDRETHIQTGHSHTDMGTHRQTWDTHTDSTCSPCRRVGASTQTVVHTAIHGDIQTYGGTHIQRWGYTDRHGDTHTYSTDSPCRRVSASTHTGGHTYIHGDTQTYGVQTYMDGDTHTGMMTHLYRQPVQTDKCDYTYRGTHRQTWDTYTDTGHTYRLYR
jgi:hypothetical protein